MEYCQQCIVYKKSAAKYLPFEVEILTPVQQLNEYIMTSLRTAEGLSLAHINNNWGKEIADTILTDSFSFIKNNSLIKNGEHLILTQKGKHFADGIAARLFS